jgi:hypothetical protein
VNDYKPPRKSLFSQRVATHPRITASPSRTEPYVLAVDRQLIVCQGAYDYVRERLQQRRDRGGPIEITHETTLLADLAGDTTLRDRAAEVGAEDVHILDLKLTGGDSIFDLTGWLREGMRDELHHEVSPNHTLIPAVSSDSHGCPYGPPEPISGLHYLPDEASEPETVWVTVIDSGYQWSSDGTPWGNNPLDVRTVAPEQGQRPAGGAWVPETPDILDSAKAGGVPDGKLDALAGHANFVAGVVARSPNARIRILNHNGGFDKNSDDFPTEAAVARSVCLSFGSPVINVGFAFRSFDNRISCLWETALRMIGPDTLLVAPAGNQSSSDERYPAALHATHDNVIGVGSFSAVENGVPTISEFSNYGPWVACSALGDNVESTFLHVKMPVEDDEGPGGDKNFKSNNWARWNGTSFAAPKVVAAIASRVAGGMTPLDAWTDLTTGLVADGNLGFVLEGV